MEPIEKMERKNHVDQMNRVNQTNRVNQMNQTKQGNQLESHIKKEVRIHPEYVEGLFEQHDLTFDVVGIGHLGCFHKMSILSSEHIQHVLSRGIELKIELPIIYESQINNVLKQLDDWLQHPVSLVVNDLGMLHELNRLGITANVPLYIGRNLVKSFYNCPWHEDVLVEEEPDVQQMWMQLNLDSEAMLHFLQQYHVRGIDVDLHARLEPSISSLRQNGLLVNGFTDYPLASISRSCHTVRHAQATIGQCQHLCETPLSLEHRQRWNRFDDTFIRISKPNREKMGQLLVFGNVVVQSLELVGLMESTESTELVESIESKESEESMDIAGNVPFEVDSVCKDLRFSNHPIRKQLLQEVNI